MIRFCTEHQISIAALYKIRAAAARDGAEQAVVPKSTAPKSQAKQTSADIEQAALKIRSDLIRQGWDAGSLSVADQMRRLGLTPPSRATLARIFTRNGVVTPQPNKKPRAAWHRFTYPDPNGCWQLDGTDYKLDNGQTRCILQVEDDHARYILASLVAMSENSDAVIAVVDEAIRRHGAPAKFLTDNGSAFNQSRRGQETRLERFLKLRGVEPITGRPGHPTTHGKNERLHQTLQKFLDAHRPIWTAKRLADLVDQFDEYYNTQRPHQGLEQPGQTPSEAYQAKPKALPSAEPIVTVPRQPTRQVETQLKTSTAGKGRYRHFKNTTSSDDGTFTAERHVHPKGLIANYGCLIYVGRRRAGETMHAMFDEHTIEVIDSNGVILGHIDRPTGNVDSQRRYRLTE